MAKLCFDNGFTLHLQTDGENFLGIGTVEHHGRILRSDALPWTVYAESETGIRFADFSLLGIERDGEAQILVLHAHGSRMPRIQEGDAMGDDRLRTRRIGSASARMRWRFRPVKQSRLHGADWDGLAWTIEIDCAGHPLHWILEEATWEIGGSAEGCTLIQRDMSSIRPEQPVTRDSAFTTTEKFQLGTHVGSYPMDMMPRGAGSSHLDFQAKGDYALALFCERPSLSRSRIDKFAGEDVIHYLDRPFFPLGERVAAPERTLMVHRSGTTLARHAWRNLWLDLQAVVRDRILAYYGMHAEIPEPTFSAHLWDAELKRRGSDWRLPLMDILPDAARMGWRWLYTFGVWESATSDPQAYPGQTICCPYAFRYAQEFGGDTGMRQLCDVAHANGISVSQWFSNHLSRYAPILREHQDWVLKEPDGDPYDASYHILNTGRMRSPYGAELEGQVRSVQQRTGLNGAFWDSFHNLGITAVDWGAPDRAPQANEIFRMLGRLQQAGYRACRPETITIFGCGQAGVFGASPDQFRRRLWSDTVENDDIFALTDSYTNFFCRNGDAAADGQLTAERYFWMAAHRVLVTPSADPWADGATSNRPRLPGGHHAEAFARVNHQYNAALPRMRRMRLVEGGDHVLWLDDAGRPACVWPIRDGRLRYTGRAISALSKRPATSSDGYLPLRAGEVLLLDPSAA
ncbi:MAG: hypothetical protein J0M02_00205 [Planctomycetes bacterium]|nr:hypothetical protein [Planctomycetota bacterium]